MLITVKHPGCHFHRLYNLVSSWRNIITTIPCFSTSHHTQSFCWKLFFYKSLLVLVIPGPECLNRKIVIKVNNNPIFGSAAQILADAYFESYDKTHHVSWNIDIQLPRKRHLTVTSYDIFNHRPLEWLSLKWKDSHGGRVCMVSKCSQ